MLTLSGNSQTVTFDWAKQMGSTGTDYGESITVDASGNVYTIGFFEGTVDFDPGAGVSDLISNGNFDIFIQKLNANGDFLWAKKMGGTDADRAISVTTDASGNVYTTGVFYGTVDFDPGAGVSNLTSNGLSDIFIQKLDANGNFLWAKQIGGLGGDLGYSITVDASGHVYTTGYFKGAVDFNPGASVYNLTSNGYQDIFIQKLDANGDFLWAKQMGGASHDQGHSITVDALGNIYTTGVFFGTVDFDPGAGVSNLTSNGYQDIFIQKLDANGNFLWVRQMGGAEYDIGNSITIDASGKVYTTGSFTGTVDFDPGAGVSNLTSNVGSGFIQKLDANGNFLWAKQMGGMGNSVILDTYGNIHTTGNFSGTVDFDPGPGVSNLSSNGSSDIFIQKLENTAVGIIENNFGTELLLYPNPTDGFFSIDLGKPYDATITISDLTGKIILSKLVENSQRINLKLEEPSGVYLLIVESAEKKAVVKLVKE